MEYKCDITDDIFEANGIIEDDGECYFSMGIKESSGKYHGLILNMDDTKSLSKLIQDFIVETEKLEQ